MYRKAGLPISGSWSTNPLQSCRERCNSSMANIISLLYYDSHNLPPEEYQQVLLQTALSNPMMVYWLKIMHAINHQVQLLPPIIL